MLIFCFFAFVIGLKFAFKTGVRDKQNFKVAKLLNLIEGCICFIAQCKHVEV